MKKILPAIIAATLVCSCSEKSPKVLILYYSQTGVTEALANEIQKQTGADTERIDVVERYDGNFDETIKRCLKEQEDGFTPTLEPIKSDISKYDIVFVGYPVWFGTYAPPIAALLADIDLCGKKIVPFCTFGSGGLESSCDYLKTALPSSEILPGFGIRAARIQAAEGEVDRFLIENGLKEGTVSPLPEYSERMPVSPEDISIYTEATDGYPFPMGKPVSVSRRDVEGGTDYIFYTVSPGRDGNETTCRVYIISRSGSKAEFTKAVR